MREITTHTDSIAATTAAENATVWSSRLSAPRGA